ncbi:hypothetical protein NIES2101_36975 [Calothrix sp. HK-06]|nr:hypothetical protein NIES2101_36975 [Calothrix sp. HK-06]
MIYDLIMPLPPTMNEIIESARSGWQINAALKKKWTNLIGAFVTECDFELLGVVWIEFHWHLKNYGRDADNVAAAAKFIMDGLQQGRAIKNDNLTIIQSPVPHYYHRSEGDDGVKVRLSDTPDFLLESFIDANQYSNIALSQLSKKISKILGIDSFNGV